MSDIFSKIFASQPLNRVAGAVVSMSDTPDPRRDYGVTAHWSAPPKTKRVPAKMPDLRGLRVGRFTVIGLLADQKKDKPRWLVRCACGDYEARSTKALRNPKNADDRCAGCRHLSALRNPGRAQRSLTCEEFLRSHERKGGIA